MIPPNACSLFRYALLLSLLAVVVVAAARPTPAPAESPPHLGFGVNIAVVQDTGPKAMGFDWMKIFGPAYERLPHRVLRRVDVNAATLRDLKAWGDGLETEARRQADWIEAWEIGNEPNLDEEYGWAAPPNATDYTKVLCEGYRRIKRADPTALVISAGLSPLGRIPFNWNGHKGYCAPGEGWCSSYNQDEREFLREMLQNGAAQCFDLLGTHPHGFAAPYDAAPASEACGPNDFCFRSVEKLREILFGEFGVDKQVAVTEFGWIVDPREVGRTECWNDPSFAGRQWQVVSPSQQGTNLRGAYEWAERNYPWMGPMFLFNYGFAGNRSCDQMGFYDVKGRPAESALRSLAKNYVPTQAAWSDPPALFADVAHPAALSAALTLRNSSPEPVTWKAAVESAQFPVTLVSATGLERDALRFSIDPKGLALGTHTLTLKVSLSSPVGVPIVNATQTLSVTLRVVPVAPPEPAGPAPGASLPALGASLAWTNPPGITQYHIEVRPAKDDGPAINLIRNAEPGFTVQPPQMGQGPYVMLPGMTYTWRVRVTRATTSVSLDDPGWSPWSEARTFLMPQRFASGIGLVTLAGGQESDSLTPTVAWQNRDSDVFYYEVQLSKDSTFKTDPATATASVYWNLVHGGVSSPANSWTVPADSSLEPATRYFWRVRPRVQGDGTPVAWSAVGSFRTR